MRQIGERAEEREKSLKNNAAAASFRMREINDRDTDTIVTLDGGLVETGITSRRRGRRGVVVLLIAENAPHGLSRLQRL